MDWKEVGKKVASLGLPLLGTAIGGPGGGAIGAVVASALGLEDDNPELVAEALKQDPNAAIKLQEIQTRHKEALEEIAFKKFKAGLDTEIAIEQEVTKRGDTTQQTMRAELQADSGYRAGWRPLFGYITALGTGGLLFSLVYSIFKNPAEAGDIIEAATVVIFMMLTVLGVNITKRSQDKQVAMLEDTPLTMMGAVAKRISGK